MGVIVRVKNKVTITLPRLFRLALKFIYDKQNMSMDEVHLMEDSIITWIQKIQFDKDMNSQLIEGPDELNNEDYQLKIILGLLRQNEEGLLERRKELFKINKIDYRKYYRLAEAYNPQDVKRANEEYEKLKRMKPEEHC